VIFRMQIVFVLFLMAVGGCADHSKESIPTYPLTDAASS